MKYEQLERCYKTVINQRNEAESKLVELENIIDELEEELINQKINTLTNIRDAIQPDGLINSTQGIKTIAAITKGIDDIINLLRKE